MAIFCTNCGTKNDDESQFCVSCGVPLEGEQGTANSQSVQETQDSSEIETPETTVGGEGKKEQEDPANRFATQAPVFLSEVSSPAGHKIKRRTVVLWVLFIVLIAGLTAAYTVLKNTVFSPNGEIQSYVSAVSSGSFEKANQMVDPGIVNDSRVLLIDNYAKAEDTRMKDVEIGSLEKDESGKGYQVKVAYKVNGVQQSQKLRAVSSGKRFLIFDSWKIVTPMTTSISVAVPGTVDAITVNGINVNLSKSGLNKESESTSNSANSRSKDSYDTTYYSTMYKYELPVYPGVAKVELPQSKYLKADPVSLKDSEEVAYIIPQATEELQKGILAEVKNRISSCTASKDLEKKGCSFSNGNFSRTMPAYTDITRTVSAEPELSKLDLAKGTFTTSYIKTSISYKYRYDEKDNWKDDSTRDSGTLTGKFSIDGDKLVVSISDKSQSDY
jgi:hypothetical protein